jgi:uncharacterized protein YbjT (DUF2867 family)
LKVLVTGASGFIGTRLVLALTQAGHEVVCAARTVNPDAAAHFIAADFTRDHSVKDWLPRLAGVHVVVNLVGILKESRSQTFAALHELAPRALFAASAEAGVRKVVQVSALGADAQATSRYHLSKRHADEFLITLPLSWVIVQPSLVFGRGGASARLFTLLASLPLIPLPGHGEQSVQPIHVHDLRIAMLRVIESDAITRRYIAAVGPRALSFREMIAALRAQLGLSRARFIAVPMPMVRLAATFAGRIAHLPLDVEALAMLERGNTAAPDAIEEILGMPPTPIERFIAPADAASAAIEAKLSWLLPLLRASIAIVWIVTGIISLGVYPVAQSYELLARVGVPHSLAPLALYGAAMLDLAFGIGVLVLRRRRWLWRAQIALILGYSVIIAWMLPEFWLHPFGPLLKNIPLLAAIVLLHELER